MSTLPENELDLEKLFLPAWAQQDASAAKYAHYQGEQERPDRQDRRRGPRPPRREGGPGRGPSGPRFGGDRRPRPAGEQSGGDPRRARQDRPGFGRGEPRERREAPAPLPQLAVTLIPEDKGVESLSRQIKISGRSYPLFDIAQLILQKPERHNVLFSVKKDAEGKPLQPLYVCALDDSLWLSEEEAVSHILRRHFATFYQAERTPTEPPKGKYTFVAQCGMSGVILGPPNYHDYQNQLHKLHAERFSRMPFEAYKSRVKIVRDEAVVKQWVDEQSFKTEYLCLNLPEPLKLASMDAVEKHFREVHKENIIKPVESHRMTGVAARGLRSPELARLVRVVTEDQRRFPLQIATSLSQQFASHGLQFFKVNKAITHVAVARPHFLDMAVTPVSDGVKRIVDYINAHPKCTRKRLVEALVPTPAAPPPPPAPVAEAPPVAGQDAAPAAPVVPGLTPEQTAVISDLHWLIHEGHVIEFANGILECAKRPLPRPPKPEKQKPAEPAAATTDAATAETQPAPGTESVPTGPAETSGDVNPAPAEPLAQPFSESAPEAQTPVPDAPETAAAERPAEPQATPEPESEVLVEKAAPPGLGSPESPRAE